MFKLIVRAFIVLAAAALSGGAPAAADWPVRTSELNGVTIKATPRTLSGAAWQFELVFDTHVQALADDLTTAAVLIAADGSPVAPLAWQGDPPGGHHRKGILRFKALEPAPAVLELRITRPGEAAARSFKWKIQ